MACTEYNTGSADEKNLDLDLDHHLLERDHHFVNRRSVFGLCRPASLQQRPHLVRLERILFKVWIFRPLWGFAQPDVHDDRVRLFAVIVRNLSADNLDSG